MSRPLEHDYIGLSVGIPSMETSEKILISPSSSSYTLTSKKNALHNFKETELRLGLPGSESPKRKSGADGVSTFLEGRVNFGSGSKRGFSDSIHNGSGKSVFSYGSGSEFDLGNGRPVLFSPRGGKPFSGMENNFTNNSGTGLLSVKNDAVPPLEKLVHEKKQPQNSAAKSEVVGWPPIRSFRKNTMATNTANDSDDGGSKSGSRCLYVKVSMDGAPYLRKVDLKTYSNYVEFLSALEKMFSCFTIGQCGSDGVPGKDVLSESRLMDLLHGSQHVLTYEDKDDDWMLVGDVPWEMFIDSCKRLRIMKGSEAIGLAPRTMEKYKSRN